MMIKCVVAENIYNLPPHRRLFLVSAPPPLWKFPFSFIFLPKKFLLLNTPASLGISNNFSWDGMDIFLDKQLIDYQ